MHTQYRQPPRRSPAVVVALVAAVGVAVVAVIVAAVAVAFARSPEAAGWDQATIRACEKVRGSSGGLDGKGQAAIRAAAGSDQAELRQAAARYLDEADPNALDMRESVLRIARWCRENGINRIG